MEKPSNLRGGWAGYNQKVKNRCIDDSKYDILLLLYAKAHHIGVIMKIIIVGLGNVGRELVAELAKENHDIVVIDKKTSQVESIVNTLDVNGVVGNGASVDALKEAEVQTADLFISCTSSDETNILCALVAKKLGAKDTIARVRTPEYFKAFKGQDLSLSMMINPEYETALSIARILRFNSAMRLEPFADNKVDVIGIKVTRETGLINLELKNLGNKFIKKVLVCAVDRGGQVYIPDGNFVLKENDEIYATASTKNLVSFFKTVSGEKRSKSVMIIGGNQIAFYLAKELEKRNIEVKIIEADSKRCQELSEALGKAVVIHGEGTDQELLQSEGLSHTDAVVTLLNIDEQNIIVSMFAKSLGVKKVVTRVDKDAYYSIIKDSGIDSFVSAKSVTADEILRYTRAKSASKKESEINKLYHIINDETEVIEFTVAESFRGLNVPLKDLKLENNVLIATIVRNDEVIIPSGGDHIEKDDIVLVVTTNEDVENLNDILI